MVIPIPNVSVTVIVILVPILIHLYSLSLFRTLVEAKLDDPGRKISTVREDPASVDAVSSKAGLSTVDRAILGSLPGRPWSLAGP